MAMEVKGSAIPGVRGSIYRNPTVNPSFAAPGGVTTLYENWQRCIERYGNYACVGYRPINAKGEAQPYEWLTYNEADERAANFGAGLLAHDLCEATPDFKFGLCAFYAKNRLEWTIGEQACNRYNIVAVPLYDTLGMESVRYVIDQTSVNTVLCTSDVAHNVLAAGANDGSSLKAIVLMDDSAEAVKKISDLAAKDGRGVQVFGWKALEEAGKAKPVSARPPNPHDTAFFCYTSGTTGNPKGALITHTNMVSQLAAMDDGEVSDMLRDDGSTVHLSYLPLPHVFERLNQLAIMSRGGRIGYYQGDTLKILEDLVALRPTFFPSVPRLLSRIYDKLIAGVEEAGGLKKTLFNTALSTKVANLRADKEGAGSLKHRLWDGIVFGPLKKRLGLDRVEVIITGSAPLSSEVMSFLRAVFGVPVIEGYGQTETSAGGSITMPGDYTTGHVGIPGGSLEICLFDVAEMGYISTDTKHQDTPCRGRGEICFRGPGVFKEYYKMPEKTAETIDDEGWLHSGDIGVWTMDRKLKIVDRKKNIFKLSQGEYVAAEKIENVYAGATLLQMSFVYGDSLQSCLVAIVVPDEEALRTFVANPENKIKVSKDASFAQLCADPAIKKAVFAQMNAQSKAAKLKGFENAKAIHLEHEVFSVDNGMLTPTFKLKRPEARDHYRPVIDKMYEEINSRPKVAKL